MRKEISRGDVWNVVLDPIKGSEQAGLRPCAVVSPDSMNNQLETVIVVPLSTKLKDWPTRANTLLNGVEGQALCEQIRTVSRTRLKSKIAKLNIAEVAKIKLILKQMFFE